MATHPSRLLAFSATLAMIIGAAPAGAQSPDWRDAGRESAMRVAYGDLDLASAEGAQELRLRLRRAVRRVCAAERSRERWDFEVMVSCQRLTLTHVERALAATAERTRLAATASGYGGR